MITSVLVLSFGNINANAQSTDTTLSKITLSPAVSKPSFDAGDKISDKLTVINDGNEGYTFVVYAGPFSVKDEDYDPNYTTVNASNQAYQWVQFEKTSFYLKAGERVDVPYTITVPKDAAPGGHYAVLFAETQPTPNSASVSRKKRVGALLYMTVDGETKLQGSIESWSTNLWQKYAPIVSNVRIKNDGNTHFQADTSVTYKDIFGKKKFTLNQQSLILPGTTRRLPIEWQNPPKLGIFKVGGQVAMLDHTEQLPEKYIIFAPLWTIYVLIGLVVLAISPKLIKKIQSKRNVRSQKTKK